MPIMSTGNYLLNYIGENSTFQTPYYVYHRETTEPTVLIEAGIHGDEIAGVLAVDWLVPKIRVLAGTLILFPRMNILACQKETRFINVDLNKIFPGKEKGEPYELDLAWQIFNLVGREKVQYLLTLHESKSLHDPTEPETYGQTIVYGVKPQPACLIDWIEKVNRLAQNEQEIFRPYYYPIETSSTETLVSTYHLKGGFCVETWRGFCLPRLIELQKNVIFSFFDMVNLQYHLY